MPVRHAYAQQCWSDTHVHSSVGQTHMCTAVSVRHACAQQCRSDTHEHSSVGQTHMFAVGHHHIYIYIYRVGQNHIIYGVYTVLLAGKLRNIRSYTVYIYGSGQPYIYTVYIRCFWQGNHRTLGHVRCVYIRFWPTLDARHVNTVGRNHWHTRVCMTRTDSLRSRYTSI